MKLADAQPLTWLYVRIAKTGSTSIRRAAGRDAGCGTGTHSSAMRLREQIPATFAKAFKFSFVRNPWDRTVSLYHFRGAKGSFDQWVRQNLGNRNRCLGRPGQYISCWDMLSDGEQILVDYVGRFETLAADWDHVRGVIGTGHRVLARKNVSPKRRPYPGYYTPELVALVGEAFADDVKHFGYTYE